MRINFLMWISGKLPAKAIDLNDQYYIERYHVLTIGKLTILLHRYFACDGDRHQHNHPWKWCLGIPLIGGYNEERLTSLCPTKGAITKVVKIRPWRWNLFDRNHMHRVAAILPKTWTLFITYNRCQEWGELKPDPSARFPLVFDRVPGAQKTKNDWYKFSKTGNELRKLRGTDYVTPLKINIALWSTASILTLIFCYPGLGK